MSVYYESDSPCRRCNGTLRYRNTEAKGKCVVCVVDADRDQQLRSYILTSPKPTTNDDDEPA